MLTNARKNKLTNKSLGKKKTFLSCHSAPNPLPVSGGIAPMSCFTTVAAVAEEEEAAVEEEEGKAAEYYSNGLMKQLS